MNENKSWSKKSILNLTRKFFSKLGILLILLVLPALTIWTSLFFIQRNLLRDSRIKALNEMAEMTANMLRKAEPETFYQESLRDLCEKFKWVNNDISEVQRIGNKDILELALFDENGERLKWPVGENITKIKPSQSYLAALRRFAENPGTTPTHAERSVAIGYSGNEVTLSSLSSSPNTLVNFQGIGLRKMGGWYKIQIGNEETAISNTASDPSNKVTGKTAYLIAWLNLEKLDKFSLAEQTIKYMQSKTSPEYTFSYIDLKSNKVNKSSFGRQFKPEVIDILVSKSLKSGFIFQNELFSINDTQEGIRLICSRPSPKPLPLLKDFNNILSVFIPFVILLFIWKFIFNIKYNISIKYQAAFIFGYAAFIGFISILIATIAYQYEKQITLTQKYKTEAFDILEKIDQQYSEAFDDLLFQYRHFNEELCKKEKSPAEILSPLLKAQKEEIISYSVYIDKNGEIKFQAPLASEIGQTISIASRYYKIVNNVAIQSLNTYNSSRSDEITDKDSVTINNITKNAVEKLLSGRSKFIATKLDNEDTLAFMDFTVNNQNIAEGCLLIVHEPRKLEMNYLQETGINVRKTKDFKLIAFPKSVSDPKLYYPEYNYLFEEPIWKLNDMVNQTQLPSIKTGYVKGQSVIVAALPANQMKNYNLFLSIPIEKIEDKVFSLSKLMTIGTAFSLILIIIITIIIAKSLTEPAKILKNNANIIKDSISEQNNMIKLSGNNQIENISCGITDLVLRTQGFEDYNNLFVNMFPSNPYSDTNYEINSIDMTSNNYEVTISSLLEDDNIFLSYIRAKDKNLYSSISLAMSNCAMNIFTEKIGMKSPFACIKNLDEYFRINYKREIEESIVASFVDTKQHTLFYCGFGDIILLNIDHKNKKSQIIKMPNSDNYMNNIKTSGDIECNIIDNNSYLFLPNNLSEANLEFIIKELEKEDLAQTSLKEKLEEILRNLPNKKDNFGNILFIHRKRDEEKEFMQKLAENNPIAFIRSQNTGRQING